MARKPEDRFTVIPSTPKRGESVTIVFKNPDLANQTVAISIRNEMTARRSRSIMIVLTGNGLGCAKWAIPEKGWDAIILSHESSLDHVVDLAPERS